MNAFDFLAKMCVAFLLKCVYIGSTWSALKVATIFGLINFSAKNGMHGIQTAYIHFLKASASPSPPPSPSLPLLTLSSPPPPLPPLLSLSPLLTFLLGQWWWVHLLRQWGQGSLREQEDSQTVHGSETDCHESVDPQHHNVLIVLLLFENSTSAYSVAKKNSTLSVWTSSLDCCKYWGKG